MQIFKEYCPASGRCVIRTNVYGRSLALMLQLFEVAKRDFPELTTEQVEIVQYAGKRYRRTFGIEFKVETEVPDDYSEITQHEETL